MTYTDYLAHCLYQNCLYAEGKLSSGAPPPNPHKEQKVLEGEVRFSKNLQTLRELVVDAGNAPPDPHYWLMHAFPSQLL